MIKDFRDFIGVGIAGLLSVLWFDLRSIRKDRSTLKEELDQKYLSEEKHGLLCENVCLQFTNTVNEKLQEAKNEIISAIKENNK